MKTNMIIKNLQLKFDRQEGDKVILKTEAGAEVWLTDYLLDEWADRQREIFLGVDREPMLGSMENKKDTLNELLDNNG